MAGGIVLLVAYRHDPHSGVHRVGLQREDQELAARIGVCVSVGVHLCMLVIVPASRGVSDSSSSSPWDSPHPHSGCCSRNACWDGVVRLQCSPCL